jgi:hypothetical protein
MSGVAASFVMCRCWSMISRLRCWVFAPRRVLHITSPNIQLRFFQGTTTGCWSPRTGRSVGTVSGATLHTRDQLGVYDLNNGNTVMSPQFVNDQITKSSAPEEFLLGRD